ncbi:hypothetical protein LCL97_04000 [Seohaeicola saemankumensis]|nr:hypothetical protein [Seohaeicola saemankumensis]MCA0869971.1 hypothetical protein [Seohaeicola saemankumensis]
MDIASLLFFTAAEIGSVLGPFSMGSLSNATCGFQVPIIGLSIVAATLLMLALPLSAQQR